LTRYLSPGFHLSSAIYGTSSMCLDMVQGTRSRSW